MRFLPLHSFVSVKFLNFFSILLTFVFLTSLPLRAAEPSVSAENIAQKLILALTTKDHASFVSDGDASFKTLKKEDFNSIAANLAPHFKEGYTLTYLGELRQQGYQVTLWKLTFKNGKDDALATLSMKEGKIGGFWIR